MFDKIKRAAVDAVEATNPVNILYGTVEKSKPLEIRIHENLKLTEEFLDVAEHLTRHERVATIEHKEMAVRELGDKKEHDFLNTDDKAPPYTEYKHNFIKFIFEDGLKKGDKVVIARVQGGHRFLVLDRYKEGEKVWSYPAGT